MDVVDVDDVDVDVQTFDPAYAGEFVSVEDRLGYCIEVGGGLFEHLILSTP